jgi:hypothetical protein
MPGAIHFMRRILLLATTLLLPGLLPGCAGSGFYSYLGNTFTLPFGANPNKAPGTGENYAKVRGKPVTDEQPILFEAGDVWPPPPKPPMTLKDIQAQQTTEMKNGESGYTPLQPLPNLPGYEVPEQQAAPFVPGTTFPKGSIRRPGGGPIGIGSTSTSKATTEGDGTIVVPNGNGTSTVISPTGAVTTIKTPGK